MYDYIENSDSNNKKKILQAMKSLNQLCYVIFLDYFIYICLTN